MSFGKPKMPKPPPTPAPSFVSGDSDQFSSGAFSRLRKRIAQYQGRRSTILATGNSKPTTGSKTLLGS